MGIAGQGVHEESDSGFLLQSPRLLGIHSIQTDSGARFPYLTASRQIPEPGSGRTRRLTDT